MQKDPYGKSTKESREEAEKLVTVQLMKQLKGSA